MGRKSGIAKLAKRGFRGYPVAAIAYYRQTADLIMADRILGCPHEEGIDYPDGESCPECPYRAGRDRFTGDRLHRGGHFGSSYVMADSFEVEILT